MIPVQMGQRHQGDIVGGIACRLQALGKLASATCAVSSAEAGIDEDDVRTGIDKGLSV